MNISDMIIRNAREATKREQEQRDRELARATAITSAVVASTVADAELQLCLEMSEREAADRKERELKLAREEKQNMERAFRESTRVSGAPVNHARALSETVAGLNGSLSDEEALSRALEASLVTERHDELWRRTRHGYGRGYDVYGYDVYGYGRGYEDEEQRENKEEYEFKEEFKNEW